MWIEQHTVAWWKHEKSLLRNPTKQITCELKENGRNKNAESSKWSIISWIAANRMKDKLKVSVLREINSSDIEHKNVIKDCNSTIEKCLALKWAWNCFISIPIAIIAVRIDMIARRLVNYTRCHSVKDAKWVSIKTKKLKSRKMCETFIFGCPLSVSLIVCLKVVINANQNF